jgi:hypothetical protein
MAAGTTTSGEARERPIVRRRRSLIAAWLPLVLALAVPIEAGARERWGPFRGTVVDGDTGEPIVGAVVLVTWWELHGIGFIGERFFDAREAVTGPDGRFEVPRLGGWKLSVQPPRFHIFTPGYVWDTELVTPPDAERFVAPTLVKMRRLKTREERLKNLPTRPSIPDEKMRQFTRALNVEYQALGFSPYPVPGEIK